MSHFTPAEIGIGLVYLLAVGLLVATLARRMAEYGSQAPQLPLVGRIDRANNVICYSTSPSSEHLSCVYIPPDGVQVNVPLPGPSKT